MQYLKRKHLIKDFVYLHNKINLAMTSLELKKLLMHRIAEINDVSFLNAIRTILDSKAQNKVISLTEEQRFEIIESKKEIEKGFYFDQLELDKEIGKWLNAK